MRRRDLAPMLLLVATNTKENVMKRITTITAALAVSLAVAPGASAGFTAGGPMTIGAPPPPPRVAVVTCDSLQTCADLAVLCKKAGGKFTDTSTSESNLSARCEV